ncbi:MAG: hypothetical protein RLZ87_655, partial [Armatimonadota bacterium]
MPFCLILAPSATAASRKDSLVVSHDLASVQRIADRIAFLDQGEIVYLGPTAGFL